MMKAVYLSLLVAAPLAQASAATPVDNFAASSAADRYQAMARAYEAAVAKDPADESAWINLAVAYRHIGRGADAVVAYRRVLALENVMLDTADGRALWSHDVARRALMPPVTITAR